jgi:hypothetical protein
MTTRIKGFWVALDADYRDDDVEELMDAVGMLRGVAGVEAVASDQHVDWMARERVKAQLEVALAEAITKVLRPTGEER